jgi:hypothetical protein
MWEIGSEPRALAVQARRFILVLVSLMAAGLIASGTAAAAEPEVPFWNVAGHRLESGTRSASIVNANGVKTTLRSQIKGKEVEIQCEKGALAEGVIEGSQAKHAGKAAGALELSGCKLFAKEGSEFKENKGCAVEAIKSAKLSGNLWLEGKKGEGSSAVVVFESKESPFAKVAISNTGGCDFTGNYGLSGSFAVMLMPQNEEFQYIQWVLPETAIASAWRPPGEEGETKVGLKLEGNAATLQGEMKIELTSLEVFGGGVEPMAAIEAPFWGVDHKRLQNEEEDELEETTEEPGPPPAAEASKLAWKIKSTEVETRCNKVGISGARIVGSLGQHDGKFKATSMNFGECSFWAKEKGSFVEQTECEVPAFSTNSLVGKLWLLGFRKERHKKPRLVLEPTSLTGGKPVIVNETIKPKSGGKCTLVEKEEKFPIEGAMPMQTNPENSEKRVLALLLSESSAHVWQSAEQEAEKQVVIANGKERIFIKIPKINVKPKKHAPSEEGAEEVFGDGSSGIGTSGPGPFWLHRASSKEAGTEIESGAPESISGEATEQKLKATLDAGAFELSTSSVALKGTLFDNAMQGQATVTLAYSSPKLIKPVLKECTVTIGEKNESKMVGHLVWKWNGEVNQLTEGSPTAQAPALALTASELGSEAVELPKGTLTTLTLKGSGCGIFAGTFPVVGNLLGFVSPWTIGAWSTSHSLNTTEAGESLQHFWNGNEFIGASTGMTLAGGSAVIVGQVPFHTTEEVSIAES